MKNIAYIIVLLVAFCWLASCNGDHSTRSNIDTVKNQYGADTAKSNKANIDTGIAKSEDNSASGGTKALKDTSKQKDTSKKK